MKEAILSFVKSNRNYRGYDLHLGIIDKVFNNGNGSLNLFRFYQEKKIIVINKTIYNKSDERKLKEFCRDCHIEDWQWKFASLSYPDYYFHKLSISLCD